MPSRPLFFIALGLFGLYAIEFGVVGILPAIIDRYGITVAQAGGVVGFFALIVAVCGPFMVLWLSRFDRRKVLTGSLLAFAACSALSAWAPSFPALMAARVLPALLHPVFFSIAFATAVSLYPAERATHATAMAFVGTSMGLVLGVPLTTWIDSRVSYEASFLFCAAVNLIAALGLWAMLPSETTTRAPSNRQPLVILRKPALWLAVSMTVCVFAAMFSVYSYAAEYLARQAGMDGEAISILLVIFGIGGVLGNLLAGRWLGKHRTRAVLLYPVTLAGAYAVLHLFGSASLESMLPISLLWGAAHTSGLIVSQVWLTSAAPEAPEFATSLYVSAANLGVVFGSTVGGSFISAMGMVGALWSGGLFCCLAIGFIALRLYALVPTPSGESLANNDARLPCKTR